MAIPLVIAALISGLVCFLLARYLTTPIDRLRRATYHYANGDLAHRVLPSMNDRKDEIADLARDFDDMAQHLQTLIASHKQLLSDVSHELRSPLARMQVALGLAQQREGEAENPELARIELEAERLNELIGQLLTLSRMESATADLQITEIDLRQLLLEIAKNANYEAAEKDCDVKLASPESIMLEADPQLLRSALENIVRNAVIYTDQATSIDIIVQTDAAIEQEMLITIHDHGPGVPEDMLPRLFDPFVRVGEARDRQTGGYGLGLAIAERAIRLHGGMIEAENAPGGGLIVCVRLPCRQSK
jgi:two-component system sensor histidine kinase CpxA